MKSPLSSVTSFTKVNSKLFISIANPFLLEVEELKYALYPHFEAEHPRHESCKSIVQYGC